MRQWLRERWQRVTTQRCESCGVPVAISAYRKTGASSKGTWWASGGVEPECPHCRHTFWVKK